MPRIGGLLKSKQRMAGFQWTAADIPWTWGTGPAIDGTAEALILAASGRPIVLDELSGEGAGAFRHRLNGS